MRYTLINRRKSVDANNNSEFVKWMRKHDLQQFATNEEFMQAYSQRKATFEKIMLRPENEDVFVEDLEKNHLLNIENESKKWNLFKI